MGTRQGVVRLFRVAGIDVFLHWSWFLIAAFEISGRSKAYSSLTWNILEYLALFVIVLLHEFGHALACRQVGGIADQIMLWPLGGVAYVDPPPRPGATLWSIAAGPLVNVALLAIVTGLGFLSRAAGWPQVMPNVHTWLRTVWNLNLGLLLLNLLPIYPLDGGQIFRSLLWFVIGRARSLMVAVVVGIVGVVGLVGIAVWRRSVWVGVISAFLLMNCWRGLKQAQALSRLAKLPRRHGYACPWCKSAPPVGDFWTCNRCGKPFDTFQTGAACPHCGTRFAVTQCLDCLKAFPINAWVARSSDVAKPVVEYSAK